MKEDNQRPFFRQGGKPYPCFFGNVKSRDKFVQGLALDGLATGERLELLVCIGSAVAAHDCLHGFGKHFGIGRQVLLQSIPVNFEFVEATQARFDCEQTVSQGH